MLRHLVTLGLLAGSGLASIAGAGEVRGRVAMPDACSPSVSPAVVTLEPVGAVAGDRAGADAAVALAAVKPEVHQHGLQFEPRVQLGRVGRPIRFTNQDREPHNVHSTTPGVSFSWSMAPNATQSYTPTKPEIIKLVCDVHSHMRGYVVVTDSPWAKVVRAGDFTFRNVPEGRYTLVAWHEMGPEHRAEVEVKGDATDLGTITLQGAAPSAVASSKLAAPVVAWPEVIDRIGVLLGEARAVAGKPGGVARARKLAEDAYWGEFELSDMETAVRRHLGYARAGAIEAQLRGFRSAIKAGADGQVDAADLRARLGKALIELSRASDDLRKMNILDRRDVGKGAAVAEVVATVGRSEQARQLTALADSFDRIQGLADARRGGEAASAMTDAYFNDFEPLERLLTARAPQAVRPLEARFNAIRGQIDSGVAGSKLADQLEELRVAVNDAIDAANSAVAGSFAPAFLASLSIILREGVEVILLLTMLIALAAKAGRAGAMRAIWGGVAVAVVASLVTAVGLNRLVASAQGRTREVVEGAVMLLATAILYYVSYWLISQTQAKRWADYLKQQALAGAKVGGVGTLALTAFLAVYREGAETALMYQAMIADQGGAREGLMGLAAGVGLGVVLLGVVAAILRASSVRLPIRPFFKVTGFLLFAMAVVFAGNGVFELQSAGYIKVTPVAWVGLGVPVLGIHPNVQTLVTQGFLILGALLALVLPAFDRPRPPAASSPAVPGRIGVGVGAGA